MCEKYAIQCILLTCNNFFVKIVMGDTVCIGSLVEF